MKAQVVRAAALGAVGTAVLFGQAPAPAPRQGPGVQAANDARYAATIAQCKTPPPAPAARAGGPPAAARQGGAPAPPAGPVEYAVKAIPGVIAADARWTIVLEEQGNNLDGIIGTDDGALLIAQNDKSDVLRLDKDGKTSVIFADTNTGGALSINKKGEMFVAQRALNPAIWQLRPQRKLHANRYQGDTLDCLGGVLNDIAADSNGGVYFTMGGLYYADAKGVITKYGENLRTNGVILSPDEKTLYVTNAGSLAAFDVQPTGALTNQREFVTLEGGGGDGATVDSEGRIYVTGGAGVNVISRDGKYLGAIPVPIGVITTAFGGPDKKTLYAIAAIRGDGGVRGGQVLAIPMLAQGYKGRPK